MMVNVVGFTSRYRATPYALHEAPRVAAGHRLGRALSARSLDNTLGPLWTALAVQRKVTMCADKVAGKVCNARHHTSMCIYVSHVCIASKRR